MNYYLLNHLSTEALILVVVGVPSAAAMLVALFVDRLFPRLRDLEIHDNVREVVGLMFGLLLALVIAASIAKYEDADGATAAESTATAQLTRASRTFPIAMQIKLEKAIRQYVHSVVEDEWTTMRSGQSSARATATLETIYATLQGYRAAGEPALSVYRRALVQIDEVAGSRRARLDLSSQSLPPLLRLLLIFGAISFVALSCPLATRERAKKLAITGAITAFVCFAYMLTIVFDYPFSGALAVGNDSFEEGDLAIYWASATPRKVSPSDVVALTSRDLVGVWTSDAFGPTVFRQRRDRILGALRLAHGTVEGRIEGGVLQATWCEAPTRLPPDDRGQVEWRRTKSGGRDVLVGRWRYGTAGRFYGGWDLTRLGGAEVEPPDVTPLFNKPSRFCASPTSNALRLAQVPGLTFRPGYAPGP